MTLHKYHRRKKWQAVIAELACAVCIGLVIGLIGRMIVMELMK